jgi:hypothetical protein
MAQKLFYTSMAVTEIAYEIDNTVWVGITKTNAHLSPVAEHVTPPCEVGAANVELEAHDGEAGTTEEDGSS